MDFCRSYLHQHGFITYAESEKIYDRIKKYQDENEIEITEAQLLSVEIKYDDNAKFEEVYDTDAA